MGQEVHTMRAVPRIGRMLDLAGLLLFTGGGATFVRAWIGFRRVTEYEPPADAPPWAAVTMAEGYSRLQGIGAALMLAGVIVFIFAWWIARRLPAGRRQATIYQESSE